jgi:hypothetical protein
MVVDEPKHFVLCALYKGWCGLSQNLLAGQIMLAVASEDGGHDGLRRCSSEKTTCVLASLG